MSAIKLVLSMESENGNLENNENNEVQAAELATQVEASTSELNEIDDDVEDYADGIETSVDATGELDEVADQLEEGVESGEGVSEQTAKMAEIAVEAICAKVGISARQARIMPAMESFGSSNSRLTATKMALEGIGETAGRIWKAIKEAFVKVWEMIKGFFGSLGKSRVALEKHLKNLQEKAGKAEGAPKEAKFSTGAKAFTINGKADMSTVVEVLESTNKLTIVANKASDDLLKFVKDVIDGKTEASTDAIAKRFAEIGKATGAETTYTNGTAYGNFVYGKAIVIMVVKSLFGQEYSVIALGTPTAHKAAKDIVAPKKEEILKVLDLALANVKVLMEYEKVSKLLEQANKAAIAFADKMVGIQQKGAVNSEEDKKAAAEKKKANDKSREQMKVANKLIAHMGTKIPGVVYAGSKAAAEYASAGIANLQAAK